jgi:hypothetical protein
MHLCPNQNRKDTTSGEEKAKNKQLDKDPAAPSFLCIRKKRTVMIKKRRTIGAGRGNWKKTVFWSGLYEFVYVHDAM